MYNKGIFLISITVIAGLYSCKVSKPVSSVSGKGLTEKAYIAKYKDLAVSEMNRTGVPASITLAQGIIESGVGKSTLSTGANNHFGIKCHNDWDGPTVRYDDDRRNECFRKYSKAEDSYRDHSDFLRNTPRYKPLFSLSVTDYKGWARGLKNAGYATNPDYAGMLIRKIEQYQLYNYDKGLVYSENKVVKPDTAAGPQNSNGPDSVTLKESSDGEIVLAAGASRIMEKNRIQYITIKQGDTREKIEKEFKLLSWEIAKYNDLPADFTLKPGQILFLQPKRERAEVPNEFHTVASGESMYYISQIYGIKLKSLLLMNRMTERDIPSEGQKLWLRSTKPVD